MSDARWCERCGAEAPGPWGRLVAVPGEAGARLYVADRELRTRDLVHVALPAERWIAGRLDLRDLEAGRGPPIVRVDLPRGWCAALCLNGPARVRLGGLCSCSAHERDDGEGGELLRERSGGGPRFVLGRRRLRDGEAVEALIGNTWVAGTFEDPGRPADPVLRIVLAGVDVACRLHVPAEAVRLRRLSPAKALA